MYTLGSFLFALQVREGGPSAGLGDIVQIVTRATLINQFVLLVLILFSVACWAIILLKFWSFRSVDRHTKAFLDAFRRSSKFSEVAAACPAASDSPLVGVFQAGYAEITAQFRLAGAAPQPATGRPVLKSLDAVDRALIRAATSEVSQLERRLTFLATTASVAPFIGLFGTVFGILIAFERIGSTGSTDLAVVGPAISEALLATAMGLAAAIPAVLGYNHFTHQIKTFSGAMDDFALEFLNISERNFT